MSLIGPDEKELNDYLPHWRLSGHTDIVNISPLTGNKVNIKTLKEGLTQIVVEDKGAEAIVECIIK